MSTDNDRLDLPTFDGLDIREHAARVAASLRAINHITGWPHGMTYPSDAYVVLSSLTSAAALLPQAFEQIAHQLETWRDAGHIDIDPGTEFEDHPGVAIATTSDALHEAEQCAYELHEALGKATEGIAYAHWTGPAAAVMADDNDGQVSS